jgi:cytochrome o ubiquinol oxidase subunit 2
MIARMRSAAAAIGFMRLFVLALMAACLTGCEITLNGLLNPKGIVAYQERQLFVDTLALMLIVVLPVIIMSIAFVYHYRRQNHRADYRPDWSHSVFLEAIWWGVPCAIILILAIMTWKTSHELDPYRPIKPANEPTLLIQAVALPWKWLFIYPAQGVATVNELVLPVNQQVEFWITADNVPMSALFVPQLGSQIYAMAGMRTRLYLYANEVGEFEGMNTQYNGDGFSDMKFNTRVVEPAAMDAFFKMAKASKLTLNDATYQSLLQPSIANPPAYYSGADNKRFNAVIDLYMNTYGKTHPRGATQSIQRD